MTRARAWLTASRIGLSAATGLLAAAGAVASLDNAAAPSNQVTQVAQAATARISGTLYSSANGRPIRQGRIEIVPALDAEGTRERQAARDAEEHPIARAATDASGAFDVAFPEGMRLAVIAEARGHARSRLGRPVTLSQDRDLGRFDLPRGRGMSGKVTDGEGKPVAGAVVTAFVASGVRGTGGGASFARRMVGVGPLPAASIARTDASGLFRFDNLPERAVSIRAFAPGMAPGLVTDLRSSSGVVVRVGPGESLAGKVTAPDGKTPVAGAWVLAGDDGWDGATKSAADGSFRLEHLRLGATEIGAALPSAVITDAVVPPGPSAMYAPSASVRVSLPAAAKTPSPLLKLRQGGIVRARLLDAESREAIASATLTLDAPGERAARPATTGTKGELIFPGVSVGHVLVSAEADGYLDGDPPPFSLAAGQTREISVALRPAGSIEGTVRDRSGRPVAGATVSVAGPPPFAIPVPIPIFFPIGVDPVTTDAQGRFVLEPLPSRAELKVSVASSAFAAWNLAGIKLRPGERRKGMEVLLSAGEAITGRVLDGEGKPVPGASITASRREEGGPGGMVIRVGGPGGGRGRGGAGGGRMTNPLAGDALPVVLSGDDGAFRVRGVAAGIWSLAVEAEGFAPKTVGGLKLEDSGGLDAGDVTLEPGAALSGIVLAASGEPVPFAHCQIGKEFSVLSELTTGSDGTFITRSLAPGDAVRLSVDAEGFGSVEKAGLTPPVENLVITLSPASHVSGRVVDKETGRPVTDFAIAVSRARGMGGGAMRMSSEVIGPETPFHSEEGAFDLEDVDPGKVTMAARSAGYREAQLRDVDVAEGKDVGGLVFSLERAASVSGVVTDERGRPVAGATVDRKESSGAGFGMVIRAAAGRGASSDGDGRFVLEGLDRGAMTLSVTHPEYEAGSVDVDTTHDIENLRVTLSRGGSLSGVVLNEADGSPVDRATVSASAVGSDRFGGGRSATTGPDGAFSLDALSTGRYTVRAEAAGLEPAEIENVVIEPGAQPQPLQLKLAGGVTLTGTITGVKESELPDFTVRALSGAFGKSAPVDASGRFEMKGLSPGTMTLLAGSGLLGGRTMTKSVEIPKGAPSVETTIEFPRGNVVKGAVTRGEQPVAGASVIFRNAITRASTTASTDADGHYVAEDVDSGEYDVNVIQFSSGLSHATKLKVDGDEDFDVELPLRRLSGRVTEAGSDKPLDGASVSISKVGEKGASAGGGPMIFFGQQGARTDTTGTFRIEDLEEGAWELTARKDGYATDRRRVDIIDGAEPGEIVFELSPAEGFAFRAIDAQSSLPLNTISALVVSPSAANPLAPGMSAIPIAWQGSLSADASGLFHLNALKPGTYDVVLGGQKLASENLRGVRVPSDDQTVRMGSGGSVEVHADGLTGSQIARGVLLDAKSRLAVRTNTYFADPVFQVRASAPMTLRDVKPGNYIVSVAMPDGSLLDRPVTVAPGAEVKISVP